ncbi:hypothetical protein SAMN05444405_102300 [Bacteroides luti]|uniref:Uncharacterized protein n=1 Tax=Bacteroides luti TaxID=1297750 RepID=A0A1M4VIB9_9BACE|nr:hypothetical protein [Bacteroides luti]SHE68786.1 hypothetical protein SAMN05444405_102300 [Bacteroides luti]
MKKETIKSMINESARSGVIIRKMNDIIKTRSLLGKEDLLRQLILLRDDFALLLEEFTKIKNLPFVMSDTGKEIFWDGTPYQGTYEETDFLILCKYLPEKAKFDNEIKLLTRKDDSEDPPAITSKYAVDVLKNIYKDLLDLSFIDKELSGNDPKTWLYIFGKELFPGKPIKWGTGVSLHDKAYIFMKIRALDSFNNWERAEKYTGIKRGQLSTGKTRTEQGGQKYEKKQKDIDRLIFNKYD